MNLRGGGFATVVYSEVLTRHWPGNLFIFQPGLSVSRLRSEPGNPLKSHRLNQPVLATNCITINELCVIFSVYNVTKLSFVFIY